MFTGWSLFIKATPPNYNIFPTGGGFARYAREPIRRAIGH